ncbi:hypothetical protein RO3G_05300 [Rhizopus delemar RA 99-880]|uniref:Uncharacterized protein n=1 Tax=Rhizopus delemar (strain RA 99-880 / ATCC MYA-4621 / FGSC 9543 / NRRL 43880) TaxID=246409 RepID=I1BWL5_RHIO9|nr:hypothetical protein RO3G_05300 [Rhizopus delemar RA 99-880]|eukprot:EIE80595.1 hypothetical protein RO3G_05300 [Rhizopus delemar RA 99-880]
MHPISAVVGVFEDDEGILDTAAASDSTFGDSTIAGVDDVDSLILISSGVNCSLVASEGVSLFSSCLSIVGSIAASGGCTVSSFSIVVCSFDASTIAF